MREGSSCSVPCSFLAGRGVAVILVAVLDLPVIFPTTHERLMTAAAFRNSSEALGDISLLMTETR